MKAEQVTRLVAITGLGAGDSVGHGGFAFDHLIYPLLLGNVYADKNRQEAIIRESSLDWILVCPSVLNNKAGRGSPRALENLSAFYGEASRARMSPALSSISSRPTLGCTVHHWSLGER